MSRSPSTSPVRKALFDAGYASDANFTAPCPAELYVAITRGRQAGRGTEGYAPAAMMDSWQQMAARLDTTEGKALYKQRAGIIEPVFAQPCCCAADHAAASRRMALGLGTALIRQPAQPGSACGCARQPPRSLTGCRVAPAPRRPWWSMSAAPWGRWHGSPPPAAHGFLPGMTYPASKAAVNMITVRYAHAFPKIRINAVEPGYIATDPNLHQGMQAAEIIVPVAQVGPDVPPAFASTPRDRCLVGCEGYRVRARVALSMRSPRSSTLASR